MKNYDYIDLLMQIYFYTLQGRKQDEKYWFANETKIYTFHISQK